MRDGRAVLMAVAAICVLFSLDACAGGQGKGASKTDGSAAQVAADGVDLEALDAALTRDLEAQTTVRVVEINRENDAFLQVTIPNDALFEFGQTALLPRGQTILSQLADILKQSRGFHLEVLGHTDSVGSDAYNRFLSEQQAQAVRSGLIAAGIPGENIKAVGRGEEEPRATNETEEGRSQNRRTEIRILPDIPPTGSTPAAKKTTEEAPRDTSQARGR